MQIYTSYLNLHTLKVLGFRFLTQRFLCSPGVLELNL